MFKVLIVEDSTDKLREISRIVESIQGIDPGKIDSSVDATGAKKLLRETHYDLLILDISIPSHKTEEINPLGGLELLDEVLSRSIYKTPTHIIGLTAYEEVFTNAQDRLKASLNMLIHYDLVHIDWKSQLKAGIEQRIEAKQVTEMSIPDFGYDVAVICALSMELEAHRNNGWLWESVALPNDDTFYYKATYKRVDGSTGTIVAAAAPRMGMTSTSILTTKLIMTFRPRYVIMTGIMAGVNGRVQLGDLVVANPVWDWGTGKWIEASDIFNPEIRTSSFQSEPFQYVLDPQLIRAVQAITEDKVALFKLRKGYGRGAPEKDFSVHLGALASGASVLADKQTLERVKNQHRKLLGIEMEAFALYAAAYETNRPKPLPICIKSVVDFADAVKDDDYQEYGAYLSAEFAKLLIVGHL